MKLTPLENIPCLSEKSLCTILQSMIIEHSGKYNKNAYSWLPIASFSQKTWADYSYSSSDIDAITGIFNAMFSLQEPSPAPKEPFATFIQQAFATWARGSRTVTFFTSGSTGKPKPCTHPEEHLRQELMGIIPLIQNRKSALVTVPLYHLYGFTFGLLLPQALGIEIRTEAPLPTAIVRQIQDGDLVVGIPLLWSHIAELASRTPCDAFLLSGTAPLPQAVFTTMLDTGYQMLEFFGSSEMGVMCCRTQPHNAFSLLPQFTRLTGEKAHCIQRTLPDGTTQDFPLQDTIEWLDERHLEPRGRKDYAVQVGGVNVSPAHVIKVLMTHPHIAACAVRLMRPEEGHRLKAFIVPQKNCDSEEIRKTLRAFVKQNLTEEEQPARFDFGEVLPLNLMGKSTDW